MREIENLGMSEEEKEAYFFDTYAFFEIIAGNPKYKKYSNCKILTTIFNLAELNYNLKKDMPKEKADNYTADYYDFAVEVTLEDIKKASDLKIKDRDLSIPDVIGYTIAKKYGVKFLTGDKGFKEFDNVEFVVK